VPPAPLTMRASRGAAKVDPCRLLQGRYVTAADQSARPAAQIACDEHEHVAFFRSELGSAAVARPTINIRDSFTGVAVAARLIKPGQTFDVYTSEDNFLRGGFIFEGVGVTGEHGLAAADLSARPSRMHGKQVPAARGGRSAPPGGSDSPSEPPLSATTASASGGA